MLDVHSEAVTAALQAAPVYGKTAVVTASRVEPGTVVRTALADGTEETVNTATADRCWRVTNPGGEQYLITTDALHKRYRHLGGDRWQARGMVRAARNPTGQPITIVAPWGKEQHGDGDCMVAAAVDPSNPDRIGADRYLIGAAEFAATYAEVVR